MSLPSDYVKIHIQEGVLLLECFRFLDIAVHAQTLHPDSYAKITTGIASCRGNQILCYIQIHIQESQGLFLVECIRLLASVHAERYVRITLAMITVKKLKTLKESEKLLGAIWILLQSVYQDIHYYGKKFQCSFYCPP
mgnify:FL=1